MKLKFIGFILLFLTVLVIGFIRFSYSILQIKPSEPSNFLDAIVVFTGGKERIKTAIDLLEKDLAKKLFISGVNKSVNLEEILKQMNLPYSQIHDKIFIGYNATNTKENAKETAEWLLDNNFKTILLVTSAYHMPRSYLELNRVMPDLIIYQYPVFAENINYERWWQGSKTTSLMVMEYFKYLAVKLQYWLRLK